MKETKHDAQRLFGALSTHEMLEEIARRETFRQQEDKERWPFIFTFVIGTLFGTVFNFIIFMLATGGHI